MIEFIIASESSVIPPSPRTPNHSTKKGFSYIFKKTIEESNSLLLILIISKFILPIIPFVKTPPSGFKVIHGIIFKVFPPKLKLLLTLNIFPTSETSSN